jgi:hypothetical protein
MAEATAVPGEVDPDSAVVAVTAQPESSLRWILQQASEAPHNLRFIVSALQECVKTL